MFASHNTKHSSYGQREGNPRHVKAVGIFHCIFPILGGFTVIIIWTAVLQRSQCRGWDCTALGAKPFLKQALSNQQSLLSSHGEQSQKQSRELHESDSGFSSVPATETFLVCNTTLFKHATISSPLSSQRAVILCFNLGVDCEGYCLWSIM